MKIPENRSLEPGNQWEGREVCEGRATVEFCQTKMETWSCKYGFIWWHIFGHLFSRSNETFISKWYEER